MNIDVMSLIIFISGVFILIYGIFFSPTQEEEEIISSSLDTKEFEKFFDKMQEKINDADKMMVELDNFTQHVTKDMEEKYKELMFLYQLIDEKYQNVSKEQEEIQRKKKELKKKEQDMIIEEHRKAEEYKAALEKKQKTQMESRQNQMKQFYVETPEIPTFKEEKVNLVSQAMSSSSIFDQILYLYENGQNIDDIAKTLGKGKGEIRLMLDLMGKEG